MTKKKFSTRWLKNIDTHFSWRHGGERQLDGEGLHFKIDNYYH